MTRIVLKFGGTSMGDLDRIDRAARLTLAERRPGTSLAVVVSAMAGETNRLVALARGAAGDGLIGAAFDDEYDVIAAAGEQVSAGLLALALRRHGARARSWLGWQAPVRTDSAHGKARITDIDGAALIQAIEGGEIAVIAGFQGIDPAGRVSTLGRGGSDTSAVAIAAAIGAARCDIYTDVDGVYTTDPRIVPKARRIARISYEEMLEMASLGAKVLQTRSVEMAMNWGVPVRVLSSFVEPGHDQPGTLVCSEDQIVEKHVVSAVAYSRDEARVTILGLKDEPGRAARVFGLLAEANINVDMIVQSQSRQPGTANLLFTVAENDADKAVAALQPRQAELEFDAIDVRRDVAKVSVIGVGMRSHAGVAYAMFKALAAKGINIEAISTSEIKTSVLVDSQYTELAVRALHNAYGLENG